MARVGDATVSVEAKLDPLSLKKVQKQIESQLQTFSKRLQAIGDRNRSIYQGMGRDAVVAWRSALGAMISSAPLIGSLTSALAGGVTMLADSLWSVVVSSSAMLPVVTSLGVAVSTAVIAFEGFGAAVTAADPKQLEKALAKLSPAAQESALAVRSLRDGVTDLRGVVQEKFFAGLSDDIEKLSSTLLPVAIQGFGKMADVLNDVAQSILDYANSSSGLETINRMFDYSAQIVRTLSGALIPFLDGFLRLMNALSPAAIRLAGRISDIASRFQEWTKGEGFANRINTAMIRAEETAGLLFDVLGNLGSAIMDLFAGVNPSTNTFLEMLVDLTDRFKDFTSSVEGQASIAKWADESVSVISQLGKTIRSVFKVLQKLSDSGVIESFLTTVQNAFDLLGKLPLDKLVSGFVSLAQALEPISGPILAIIAGLVSLQMLFGNIIGQIAGVVGAFMRLDGGGGSLTTVLRNLSGVFRLLFGWVGVIASGFIYAYNTSAPFREAVNGLVTSLLGLVQTIGTALMPIFNALVSTVSTLASSLLPIVVTAFEALIPAITLVTSTLIPLIEQLVNFLAPIITQVANIVTSVLAPALSFLAGIFLNAVVGAIQGAMDILQGFMNIIQGVIEFVTGVFTGNWSQAWEGIKTIVDGVIQAIWGAIQVWWNVSIMGVFRQGLALLRGVWSTAWNGIRTFVTGLVDTIRLRIMYFMDGVRGVITSGMHTVRSVFTTVWNGIRSFITTVMNTIRSVISSVWNGIRSVITTVVNTIRSVITAAFNGIRSIVSSITNAVRSLITSAWNAARTITVNAFNGIRNAVTSALNAVINLVKGLPGRVVSGLGNLGGLLVNSGKALIQGFIDGILSMGSSLMNAAGGLLDKARNLWPFSPAKEGPFSGKGWTLYSGRSLIEGTIQGLEDREKALRRSISSVMAGASSALDNGLDTSRISRDLASLTGSRVNVSADIAPVSAPSAAKAVHIDSITVQIDPKDLEGLATVQDFIEMLGVRTRMSGV